MGIYRDQILPRIIDKACGSKSVGKWRVRALEGLSGTVVEPGFGSGSNLPYYPEAVTKVFAVDPAALGQKLAAQRLADSPVEVEFVGLDGQSLPLEDNSCDGAVLTFTLCTIPDPMAALVELRRVLKPGGTLHFAEHGIAPEPNIQKWQHRLEPSQKRIFDGCHVTRDHPELITQAGFEMDWVDSGYADALKPLSFYFVGRATNPTS